VTQVALVPCKQYEFEEVTKSLTQAFYLIGGLSTFVQSGQRVLLKVSMLRGAAPEQAVSTHPIVAVALAKMVRELGATPVIGDSCGGSAYGLSEKALEECGFGPAAREHGIETVLFETAGSKNIPVKDHRFLPQIPVSNAVLEADVIISVPKLKTHVETLMTGAVKNMLGCLPGAAKLMVHKQAPSPEDLGHALLDIYSCLRPKLCVMDAVVGMSGDGPSKGKPAHVGALLASADGVALDHVAARLIGYDPMLIPTIAPARARGLGENDASKIEVVGSAIENMKPRDFKLCSNLMMRAIPKPMLRLLNRFFTVQPVWNREGCTQCSLCVDSCPVTAMTLAGETVTIDREKCIECFCCYELCPEDGIKIQKSLLVKLLSG
jgi:uncharacterized protein (DUF362 family)/Pyruvate/2-oxoacid:ferredoxin oxidoreductase delta subunit